MFGQLKSALNGVWRWVIVAIITVGLFGSTWYRATHHPEAAVAPEVLGTAQTTDICTPAIIRAHPLTVTTSTNRQWYLLGTELNSDTNVIRVILSISDWPEECRGKEIEATVLDVKLDHINDTTTYVGEVPIQGLPAGKQELPITASLLINDNENIPLMVPAVTITISYPVYVAWTIDWEGFPINSTYLDHINALATRHQNMPLTHFFNPRYFVGSTFSNNQRKQYRDFVLNRQKKYGDAIGLHIHAFTDVVAAAGVAPRLSPNWGNRKDGYDVPLSSYSLAEQEKIIAFGQKILAQNGLAKATLFRAGGWYANEDTLNSLTKLGFVVDSSGRTAYAFGTNKIKGNWTLSTTTQPFWPCLTNQNKACSTPAKVLEIANNGADSYAFSAQAMIQRFKDNVPSQPVNHTRVITYLSHPEWFNIDDPKIKELFTYIDKYSYNEDRGPVQYVTLQTIYNAWKTNNY